MSTSTLPLLDTPYAVSGEAIDAYRSDGHVLLRGLASATEAATYRDVIAGPVDRFGRTARPLAERDTYGKAFLQVMNLWREDAEVARFVFAKRFAGVAADLLGVERVRLYHDQALFKEAGGGHTPWHQDAVYWPIDGTRCITMWMPLIDITPDMGVMTFASGTNHGRLGDAVISDDSEAHFDARVEREGLALSVPIAMVAGDATFHGGWTLHKAGGNQRSVTRDVMTVIYFADGLVVLEPANDAQRRDLASWLPGLTPGDYAASDFNPVLS